MEERTESEPRELKDDCFDNKAARDDEQEDNRQREPQSVPNVANTSPHKVEHPHVASPTDAKRSQPGRTVRPSEEFDRRYDGPFGRPSLVMQRRRSSQAIEQQERSNSAPCIGTQIFESGSDEGGLGTQRARQPLETGLSSFEPEPPSLGYTLHTRKLSILFFWTVIVFDSVVMPVALYFGLWYGVGPVSGNEKLSANAVFSIVTAAIGGASILEYFLRFWRLYKKDSTCRVIGAHRWYLDWFHWNFSLGWIIIMFELIIGTIPRDPPIRLLSMPLSTMLFVFGTEQLVIDALRYFRVPAPVRISSIPKGAQLRPGIYSTIEDVCAVDGSGGTAFREALDRRYEASHIFRAMLRRLGMFWAFGAETIATVCTILIFTLPKDAAYTVGWTVPFIWAGVWTLCTIWYVKRELKRERTTWAEEAAAKRPV